MLHGSSIAAAVLGAALIVTAGVVQSQEPSKYPDWKGQWIGPSTNQDAPWDPNRPPGAGQNAPLTPEYRAIFEASLADRAAGGKGADPTWRCIPSGMPRVMMAVRPMEIVITPETTFILLDLFTTMRRIYTDGRAFPKYIEPSFAGHSLGRWEDSDGDGRFDTLHVETRAIKGPRTYDSSGIPFHKDGETVIAERFLLDRANPAVLQNVITTADNALTQPWTVTRTYRRAPTSTPVWSEHVCVEDRGHVQIGEQTYAVGDDGLLRPVRKGQASPDLRHFKQSKQ